MENKSKIWILGYLILVIGVLFTVGFWVVKVDPFFHYHKPETNVYYYDLDNQRSQNDGILKHFDYDALITGTSMTENFKTTEMDTIFGTHSIKVSFSGGTYKEINDNLINALSHNPNLKVIVRGLDMDYFVQDKDTMRQDLGEFPTYLYDDFWLNDIKYIFNRDIIFKRVYPMVIASKDESPRAGITPFDEYSNWMADFDFGIQSVCPGGILMPKSTEPVHLSDIEREMVLGTVRQNITSLAETYPDVTFYYFFTPYSIVWWHYLVNSGQIYRQLEAEKLVIEEILPYHNIKLYSFNNLTNLTTDLNNYKDYLHYGSWINTLILLYMKYEKCLLTYDNYEKYLADELSFYTSYDYLQLNDQMDYENDYDAEAVLNIDIDGIELLDLLNHYSDSIELSKANIVQNQYNGKTELECKGRLLREQGNAISVADYIATTEYIGAKIVVDDISDYKFLMFCGMKNQAHGQPSVYIYNEDNVVLDEFTLNYHDIDNQWHRYMINVSQISGTVTIVFNGGYIDNIGSEDSLYTFSDIVLY